MTDRIERPSSSRRRSPACWKALTDHNEFGAWFRVNLDGPFAPGARSTRDTHHLSRLRASANGRRSPRRWSPSACSPSPGIPTPSSPAPDYSKESPTLVEFTPARRPATAHGCGVVESGFDKLPAHRRDTAFRINDEGWTIQMENIAQYRRPASMPSAAAALRTRASVFAALGDETRLGLLAKLTNGEPLSIARLTEGTRRTRQAVTKHLRVLEDVGVVLRDEDRPARVARPGPETDGERPRLPPSISRQWDTALARLKALVEAT